MVLEIRWLALASLTVALAACDSGVPDFSDGAQELALAPQTGSYSPLLSPANVTYSTQSRPLLRFESHDDFDLAVVANRRAAAEANRPLVLATMAQQFAPHSRFAPAEELALADGTLRVVIADTTYQLVGTASTQAVRITCADGTLIQRVEDSQPTSGKIQWRNDTVGRGCYYYGRVQAGNGQYVHTRAIFDHSAYRQWTRLRMIAATEIQHASINSLPSGTCDAQANDQYYSDTPASFFPQAFVSAEVMGVDEGQCMGAYGTFNAVYAPTASRIYAEARRARGPNSEVHWSRHRHTTGGYITESFLDGVGNGC